MNALIDVDTVTKTFGGGLLNKTRTVALQRFSLTIADNPPSITAVVGESGSGKTTLARLILGLVSPTAGRVLYRGTDLRHMSGKDWQTFRREVQVIFQDPFEVYNPFYKVDHVLTTPVDKFHLANSKEERTKLIRDVLETVGLRPEETLGRYAHELSGGQRQRIMVARALILRPRLIVADEPASMIDASLRATVLSSLRRLNEEFGISIVYITHDLMTAYQISDNIVVLYRGSVVEAGSVELVVRQPQHPYTRLLVGSIPLPDPTKRWGMDVPADRGQSKADAMRSCPFAGRCPVVMPKCLASAPPLYRTDQYQAAACFLYDTLPILAGSDMTGAFVAAQRKHDDGTASNRSSLTE